MTKFVHLPLEFVVLYFMLMSIIHIHCTDYIPLFCNGKVSVTPQTHTLMCIRMYTQCTSPQFRTPTHPSHSSSSLLTPLPRSSLFSPTPHPYFPPSLLSLTLLSYSSPSLLSLTPLPHPSRLTTACAAPLGLWSTC